MKRVVIFMFIMGILTGCGEAPVARIDNPDEKSFSETIIEERIIEERIIRE